jgi:hypothetical protein
MKHNRFLFIVTLYAASTMYSEADSIAISNFSFESPQGDSPNSLISPPNGSIGDWQYTRTGLVTPQLATDVVFGSWGTATDGSNTAQLTFLAGAVAEVSIFQDLGTPFLSNSIYTLTFDAGQASVLSLLNGASASLFAGNTAVATLSSGSLISLLDLNGSLTGFSLAFATGDSAPLGSIGVGFSAGGVAELLGAGLVIDNVQLTVAPVPEPGTAFLIGLSGFLLQRNRRRLL